MVSLIIMDAVNNDIAKLDTIDRHCRHVMYTPSGISAVYLHMRQPQLPRWKFVASKRNLACSGVKRW